MKQKCNLTGILCLVLIATCHWQSVRGQNVGIGTNMPAEKLEVNGNILLPALQSYFIGGRTDLGNAGSRFHHSNGNTYLDNKGTGAMHFRNDNTFGATTRMVILQNGNVGIGNSNPTEALTLTGNMQLTGNVLIESPLTPTLLNNWGNGSPGGGRSVKFLKDKHGFVHIWGVANNEFGAPSGVIFILPVGYRPGGTIFLNQPGSTNIANELDVRIEIRSNGEVRTVAGSTYWVSLDNIHFLPGVN